MCTVSVIVEKMVRLLYIRETTISLHFLNIFRVTVYQWRC